MLECQDSRRHQHRHLFAIVHSLEGRADGHFRLSEAYIATDKPVHRACTLHILFYLQGCLALIGCIFIDKGGLQLLL